MYTCRYGPPTRTEYRLTVENLSSRVSWQVSSLLMCGVRFAHPWISLDQ